LGLTYPALRRLQNVERRLDFGYWIAEQADADRIANAIEKNRRQSASRLGHRIRRLTGFRDADMRWIVGLFGVKLVGLHRRDPIARLERHDHVVIALGLGNLDVAERAFHHCRRARETMLFDQLTLQAAGVNTDAHRHSLGLGLADHLPITIVA